MKTLVYPQGDELEKLIADTGQDHWVCNDEMELESLPLPNNKELLVWTFSFDKVDKAAQERMIRATMQQAGVSRRKAIRILRNIAHAVPCHLVRLEVQE